MKKYLALNVWSIQEIALCSLASIALLLVGMIIPTDFFSMNGAVAGIFGALTIRHFHLHGWNLFGGTVMQRIVLSLFWLTAVIAGGLVATILGV